MIYTRSIHESSAGCWGLVIVREWVDYTNTYGKIIGWFVGLWLPLPFRRAFLLNYEYIRVVDWVVAHISFGREPGWGWYFARGTSPLCSFLRKHKPLSRTKLR